MGEAGKDALRVGLGGSLKLEFHGSKVALNAGLLSYGQLDEVLGLADFVDQCLQGHGRPMVSTIGRTIYMAVMLAAGLPLLYAMGLMGFVIAFIIAQAIYLLWLILNLVRGLDNASFAEMVHLRFGDLRFAADKLRQVIKKAPTP